MQNVRLTANAGGLLLFWLFNCAGKTFLIRLYKEGIEAEKCEKLHRNEQPKYSQTLISCEFPAKP